MQNLDDALNSYQHVQAAMPNGLGHVEVSYHGGGEEDVVYHWASYYNQSIKPADEDWCYSWDELVSDLDRFELDADAEIWEAC